MPDYQIEFYETESKKRPAEEFILSRDKKMKAKILRAIDVLSEYGPMTREPFSKKVEQNLFELRAVSGSNVSRVLYFFFYDGRIILLNGFVKKTRKTPVRELEKARLYRDDFIKREGSR